MCRKGWTAYFFSNFSIKLHYNMQDDDYMVRRIDENNEKGPLVWEMCGHLLHLRIKMIIVLELGCFCQNWLKLLSKLEKKPNTCKYEALRVDLKVYEAYMSRTYTY